VVVDNDSSVVVVNVVVEVVVVVVVVVVDVVVKGVGSVFSVVGSNVLTGGGVLGPEDDWQHTLGRLFSKPH